MQEKSGASITSSILYVKIKTLKKDGLPVDGLERSLS